MQFSKTTEYAIRALVYLCRHQGQLVTVKNLHEELNISFKYLARLMHTLSEAGLVEATKGKHGGYRLLKASGQIRLADILKITENIECYDQCILGLEPCSDKNPCPLHQLWSEQRNSLNELLSKTTLLDLEKSNSYRI